MLYYFYQIIIIWKKYFKVTVWDCGSHSGEKVDAGLLNCNALWTCVSVHFRGTLASTCKSTWHYNADDQHLHFWGIFLLSSLPGIKILLHYSWLRSDRSIFILVFQRLSCFWAYSKMLFWEVLYCLYFPNGLSVVTHICEYSFTVYVSASCFVITSLCKWSVCDKHTHASSLRNIICCSKTILIFVSGLHLV